MIVAMIFITWVIAIMMLMGVLAVEGYKTHLKNDQTSDEDKMLIEALLMEYDNRDFGGKLHLTLSLGAMIISKMLFFWTKQNKELMKK